MSKIIKITRAVMIAGRPFDIGKKVEVDDSDATELIRLGRAELVDHNDKAESTQKKKADPKEISEDAPEVEGAEKENTEGTGAKGGKKTK